MMCVILGCIAQVCLLAVVLYESPAIVQFPVSTAGGLLLWVVWRGENQRIRADAG